MPKPTLLQEVEQFLYTHGQQLIGKKTLLDIVKKWESAYNQRIEELETKPLTDEFDRMVSEGGLAKMDRRCDCAAVRMPPCSWCEMSEEEYNDHYENRGNRYEDID
jgi:hypothetical protein